MDTTAQLDQLESQSTSRTAHATFYFPDGDVILESAPKFPRIDVPPDSTPDPPCTTLFRVHRWLLAHHSPIFCDMFSLPYPPEGSGDELADGVPVIKMMDAAEDLESIVRIFYNPTYVSRYRSLW